jgi:hypothetical protein
MSIVLDSTKLRCECWGPRSVSIKQSMNFNFLPPTTFVFFTIIVFLKAVHPFKICHHTKHYDPMWTGASFASNSETLSSAMTEATGLTASPPYWISYSYINWLRSYYGRQTCRHTDRLAMSQASLSFWRIVGWKVVLDRLIHWLAYWFLWFKNTSPV